ncbi:MAG: hypothetical protein HGJ94_00795 [Desulfosarcina sp.]|nr:hypothetical protein [Desulfosarcina sp.]MBC2744807.1 hypothetical protein [Desulfosarcina sp.]MBC2767715.1 hypothetical protein [Desulfosarcina sp.]
MLKKEHIRQAIQAISKRDAEIGYTLDELLSRGAINPVSARPDSSTGDDFLFTYNGRPARVKKIIFFNQGTAPVEEQLLIKYGEMMQQQLIQNSEKLNFLEAARAIREAGLRFLVDHEIDFALARMQTTAEKKGMDPTSAANIRTCLQAIKNKRPPLLIFPDSPSENGSVEILYSGTVDEGKPAFFIRFPFSMDAMLQAADINLEFFNIRFLLSCLTRGLEKNLFTCVVNNKIEGIVYLADKISYLHRAVEIQYIATVGGRPATEDDPGRKELRGVGTFLMAGVWMLWKNHLTNAKDLLLDAEIGARRFYEGVGFQPLGYSGFIMKEPGGRLVQAILEMAGRCPALQDRATAEIIRMIKKQIRILWKKKSFQKQKQARKHALESVKVCFQADFNPALARTALEELTRYRKKIPESDELIGKANRKN